eukprot:12336535-Alexandrium_andersonii.AAC.1
MLGSAWAPRVCSAPRGLRAYARLRAPMLGSARMLLPARAPRVCACLLEFRAYAHVCSSSAHILVSAAPRVCSTRAATCGITTGLPRQRVARPPWAAE